MTTETEVATDTTQQTETETTEREVTLDDVYRDAGLDKIAATTDTSKTQQTQTQQQDTTQQTRVEPSSVPDPYDTENFKAFMARQAAGTTALEQTVRQLVGTMVEGQRQATVTATRADIEKSVQALDEAVGLGKPKVIEAYLDGMVREDPRMKALWDNRGKNPGAWQNALKVVGKKMAEEFSVKVDPNLVSSQRARKESQRTMATTTQDNTDPLEARLGAAQGADFDDGWQRLLSGGA